MPQHSHHATIGTSECTPADRSHSRLYRPIVHGGKRLGGLTLRPADRCCHPVVRAERDPLVDGDRTLGRMLGFGLVQACTLGSILFGILAIIMAASGHMTPARACLLACVACDGLDGNLARKFKVASPFGAQMDSLADMASFGIAAPLVMYYWLSANGSWLVAALACASMAMCAAIRLARFNCTPYNESWFQGLPTTIAALILIGTSLTVPDLDFTLATVLVLACAGAMVSSMPYPKLNQMLRIRTWVLMLLGLGALISAPIAFLVVIGAFLLSGPFLSLWYAWAGETPLEDELRGA